MMIYEKNNLKINSDFEIRILREENDDIDILIPIDKRTINLYMNNLPQYVKSRFQFPAVKTIIIRSCKLKENNICTIHFLRNIDLHSSMVNFELDYNNKIIIISKKEGYVDFRVK